MFLFEKSLTGVYCNRLCDLGERHNFFHAMAELKQNSAGKNLNVTNINKKAGPSSGQIGFPLNS